MGARPPGRDAVTGCGGHITAVRRKGGIMHSGPKPNDDRSQVRNRMAVLEFDDYPNVPFDGPALPPRFMHFGLEIKQVGWPPATKRWWETIRTMPHAKAWTPTDWEFAFSTAEGHARYSEGKGSLTELRARERRMGTTMEARKDLRIRYVAPSEATKREEVEAAPTAAGVASVTKMDDFRAMYGAGA